MKAASDLVKLYDAVRYRLLRIRRGYATLSSASFETRSAIIAMSVIELDNLVLCGLREFLISSLIRARTVSGHRVSTSRKFGSEEEISAFMLSILNVVSYAKKNS